MANLIAMFLHHGAHLDARAADNKGVYISCLDVAKKCYPEIRKVVMDHLEEQKDRKRARSITPTLEGCSVRSRALPRRKRNDDEDMDD